VTEYPLSFFQTAAVTLPMRNRSTGLLPGHQLLLDRKFIDLSEKLESEASKFSPGCSMSV